MKVVKKILFWAFAALLLLFVAAAVYVTIVAFSARLSPEKLASESRSIEVFDAEGRPFPLYGTTQAATFEDLSPHTVNAFVAIEDKRFFRHRGVDYKRIFGAAWANLKHRSFRQGGSTITQQLVKNTHLSREKTVNRKIKEIKLAYDVERRYGKEEILEMYLNKIYFGNGVYGIANAAQYYFGKPASELTANESAWLAGIIKAPSYYASPDNLDKSQERKNLVLSVMLENGFLKEAEYDSAKEHPVTVSADAKAYKLSTDYLNRTILEAAELLHTQEHDLLGYGLKVYTYFDLQAQDCLLRRAKEFKTDDFDLIAVVLQNTTRGIVSYYSSLPQGSLARRQPGSAIKPILPYAAALEDGKIAPLTRVLDAPCAFGDYSPKNYGNAYYGNISIRKALEKSSNIVAVKALEYAGVARAREMAEACGLTLAGSDDHLAIALGGLAQGVTPLELANAYATVADGGKSTSVKHIAAIRDGGDNLLYRNLGNTQRAMGEDTAFLLVDMLKGVAQTGTAKKLASLPFEIAAKTGTVGFEAGNSDAWAIGCTSEHTVAVWCGKGGGGLMPGNVLGGTIPCAALKGVLEDLYPDAYPADFLPPPSVQKVAIDRLDYEENGVLNLAAPSTPQEYVITDYFSMRHLPAAYSTRFTSPLIRDATLRLEEGAPVVEMTLERYYRYKLIRTDRNGCDTVVREYEKQSGDITIRDNAPLAPGVYEYSIEASYDSAKEGEKAVITRKSLGKVVIAEGADKKDGIFDKIFPFRKRQP